MARQIEIMAVFDLQRLEGVAAERILQFSAVLLAVHSIQTAVEVAQIERLDEGVVGLIGLLVKGRHDDGSPPQGLVDDVSARHSARICLAEVLVEARLRILGECLASLCNVEQATKILFGRHGFKNDEKDLKGQTDGLVRLRHVLHDLVGGVLGMVGGRSCFGRRCQRFPKGSWSGLLNSARTG